MFHKSVSGFNFSDLVSKIEVRHNDTAQVEEATALYTNKRSGKQHPKKQQERRAKKP